MRDKPISKSDFEWITVRVPRQAYAQLKALHDAVQMKGWAGLFDDAVVQAAVDWKERMQAKEASYGLVMAVAVQVLEGHVQGLPPPAPTGKKKRT